MSTKLSCLVMQWVQSCPVLQFSEYKVVLSCNVVSTNLSWIVYVQNHAVITFFPSFLKEESINLCNMNTNVSYNKCKFTMLCLWELSFTVDKKLPYFILNSSSFFLQQWINFRFSSPLFAFFIRFLILNTAVGYTFCLT